MGTTDTYHHGNLRRELMDGALALIAEKGVDNLSLRAVAARAGVSHAAPYHHFADKAALLRALAHEGMQLLDERMAAAQAEAPPDPGEQLMAVGLAYVAFAVERPDYFAAFSAVPHSPEDAAALASGANMGMWDRLVGAVVACQRVGRLTAGDPTLHAVHLWSLVHGLALLWRTGPISLMPQAAGGLEALARPVLALALNSPDTKVVH